MFDFKEKVGVISEQRDSLERMVMRGALIRQGEFECTSQAREIQRNVLEWLYPGNLIKRVVFKPYNGVWYPCIDVMLRDGSKQSQLTFFFGKVSLILTKERFCANCGVEIQGVNSKEVGGREQEAEQNLRRVGIPVSLCPRCFSDIYYGYWDCLESVFRRCDSERDVNQGVIKKNTSCGRSSEQDKDLCEDFLNPRCGFPENPEWLNPCLKNHGLGLLMENSRSLKILIGPLDMLKYQMIWNGGLFGVILGNEKRIIDLGMMAKIGPVIYDIIKRFTKQFNDENKDNGGGNTKYRSRSADGSVQRSGIRFSSINERSSIQDSDFATFMEWLLIVYLNYYPNFAIKQRLRENLGDTMLFLRELLMNLIIAQSRSKENSKKAPKLHILSYYQLFDYFSPLGNGIREDLERTEEFSLEHYKSSRNRFILGQNDVILDFLNKVFIIVREDGNSFPLPIEEVMCAMGKYLIIKSGISDNPVLIRTDYLVGREFY